MSVLFMFLESPRRNLSSHDACENFFLKGKNFICSTLKVMDSDLWNSLRDKLVISLRGFLANFLEKERTKETKWCWFSNPRNSVCFCENSLSIHWSYDSCQLLRTIFFSVCNSISTENILSKINERLYLGTVSYSSVHNYFWTFGTLKLFIYVDVIS